MRYRRCGTNVGLALVTVKGLAMATIGGAVFKDPYL